MPFPVRRIIRCDVVRCKRCDHMCLSSFAESNQRNKKGKGKNVRGEHLAYIISISYEKCDIPFHSPHFFFIFSFFYVDAASLLTHCTRLVRRYFLVFHTIDSLSLVCIYQNQCVSMFLFPFFSRSVRWAFSAVVMLTNAVHLLECRSWLITLMVAIIIINSIDCANRSHWKWIVKLGINFDRMRNCGDSTRRTSSRLTKYR